MSITMPPIKQIPSPNYSGRGTAAIRLIIVHDTEGSYGGAVSWFTQPVSQVSAHLVMREDGGEITQMVPLGSKAWHACNVNPYSIGIEGAGVEADGFSDDWWRGMANVVAWLLAAYGLPCRWAEGGQGGGFCSHHDLGAFGGGHVDVCAVGAPEWIRFIGLVGAAHAEMIAGPLPAWGLHGAPAPHTVELPPNVPAEPSHGGAARNEPGDVVAHPTASTYPHGSAADLQWRLNKAGASPALAVDGIAGSATRNAIAAFQGKHGLFIDGLIGPLTWAALDAATT